MRVLSVDLACKRYADIGIVILEQAPGGLGARAIKSCQLGLTDPPIAEVLAERMPPVAMSATFRSS